MEFENKIKEIDKLQSEINQFRPFNDNISKQLKEYFRIGLTYSSNALEGSTLTETETKVILEDGITIGGKTLREHQEVLGHSQAYDYMHSLVKTKKINEDNIKELHRLFYYRIDSGNAGIYRKTGVIITGTDYIPPKADKLPELMKKFSADISGLRKNRHPVEFSALLHGGIVTIHPFIDGNGRTARLLMNLALLQEGYVIAIIPPVLRSEYINALVEYNKGKKTPFINFISAMVYETQKDYLRILKEL